jgi:hypothetical protein
MARSAFDEAADELYALSPREFIGVRDARAKEAKAAGDAETAQQIKALRKPTVAAWLANQLVRAHRDEVSPLLELGAALREATATLSGPELRQLSRQRNEVVQALVRQARQLARAAGQPVSEDNARSLQDTLTAALADEHAGRLLLLGRLAEPLEHSGFGLAAGSGPSPAPARQKEPRPAGSKATPPSAAQQHQAERRERLERELAEAWAAARAAADARTLAEEAAAVAEKEAAGSRARVTQARAELEAAEQALEQAESSRSEATATRDATRTEAEQATRRVSAVQRELDSLTARRRR